MTMMGFCAFRYKNRTLCHRNALEPVSYRGKLNWYCYSHARAMRVREAKRLQRAEIKRSGRFVAPSVYHDNTRRGAHG